MASIRPPAFAGQLYPADSQELHKTVRNLLTAVTPPSGPAPKAVIVPHAAYMYSGPIAASAYAHLAQDRAVIRRIVLLGPSHFVPVNGLALTRVDAFATPGGEVRIDRSAAETITALPHVQIAEEAHAHEHSLEVQLPFLQAILGDFRLIPLTVGEATPETVGRVLEALWGGPETRLVVSSDLSHYHDYETARTLDQATARAIETLAPTGIPEGRACGYHGINGLVWLARRRRLRATTIDLRNSGDTAGSRDAVVGYGAFVFSQESPSPRQ